MEDKISNLEKNIVTLRDENLKLIDTNNDLSDEIRFLTKKKINLEEQLDFKSEKLTALEFEFQTKRKQYEKNTAKM